MNQTVPIIDILSCSGQKDKPTEERVIPVKVVEITGSSLVDGQNYVGTVEEMSASSLSFQVMGNVQEILVREGQKVHKGQLHRQKEHTGWHLPDSSGRCFPSTVPVATYSVLPPI